MNKRQKKNIHTQIIKLLIKEIKNEKKHGLPSFLEVINIKKTCVMCGKEINESNKFVFSNGDISKFCFPCFRKLQTLFTRLMREQYFPNLRGKN